MKRDKKGSFTSENYDSLEYKFITSNSINKNFNYLIFIIIIVPLEYKIIEI